ncbi:spore germination protein [Lentibacillus sp. CBA3610]|uniref:spore germination protein n=1 Tax=Lentibacillus sp. CBA3610 TaxID=2518176 RepID=UPI0015952B14|nr:spore germination protein [Lentibacillus sp. CBA3610]
MKRNSKMTSILRSMGKHSQQQKSSMFTKDLQQNEENLKQQIGSTKDVIFRHFHISFDDASSLEALLVITDGLVEEDAIRNNILDPLTSEPLTASKEARLQQVENKISIFNTITNETDLEKSVLQVLKGSALLLVDGFHEGLLLKVAGYELRAVEEPETERAVRGAHDGFNESSSINISLLRRRIPHPSLQFETIQIGEYSQRDVTIGYVKDIADPKLIERVRKRLNQINVDEINHSGKIEEAIEDHPFSIFPTIGNTERPDKASALLMEGRVVLIVDGDPVSLYTPFLFLESMHSVEDYTSRPYYTTFLRGLRFISMLVSIFLPAIYIAILNFHKVMIPSDMLVPIMEGRETVPFPLIMEVLLILLMFEGVREAGVRLPQQVGSALSIVGALIFGQVAVQAGIVSAPTTIVVSIAYITSFINNSVTGAISLLRIGFIIAASFFGGYGLIIAMLGLLTHMVSLTSVGVPYMAPISPFYYQDWKDSIIRVPQRWLKKRAKSIPHKRSTRIKSLPKTGDK